ncbi:hypothetical protein BDQ12DRAFT_674490 [Crucibulum laeve]|uniref:DUF2423 domain-containing protein n=1 Tax=Crucibulum laeve TaxID=68775 RepID=A0A5C3MFF0_9AGAR|nr:hypothetical protein BDQ12DRAFT_674490 [Crucibulum laeve]
MAKSTRSKAKRSFRSKKRETGIYAATEAARLNRLNEKLVQLTKTDADGDVEVEDVEGDNDIPANDSVNSNSSHPDPMAVDSEKIQRVSTHGPRNSRREEWRKAKGLTPRQTPAGMNRQGGVAAKRKAGRSKRRR